MGYPDFYKSLPSVHERRRTVTLTQIKHMLETLMYYRDCQITHTFSHNHEQLVSVCYFKETSAYQLKYNSPKISETLYDIDTAALVLNKHLNPVSS